MKHGSELHLPSPISQEAYRHQQPPPAKKGNDQRGTNVPFSILFLLFCMAYDLAILRMLSGRSGRIAISTGWARPSRFPFQLPFSYVSQFLRRHQPRAHYTECRRRYHGDAYCVHRCRIDVQIDRNRGPRSHSLLPCSSSFSCGLPGFPGYDPFLWGSRKRERERTASEVTGFCDQIPLIVAIYKFLYASRSPNRPIHRRPEVTWLSKRVQTWLAGWLRMGQRSK